MTKILSSKFKASRRLGTSIWGSGKDSFNKRSSRPGQHGANTMHKLSDYGLHLRAKQRLKNHYGRVTEKQFRNLFILARKNKGNTAEAFIGLLESRLDAVTYRLGIAPTIFAARQIVSHGHMRVNGKRVNIPSYRVAVGDIIEVKDSSKQLPIILESVKNNSHVPDYFEFNAAKLSGKMLRVPLTSDVPYPFDPEVHLVVELYSK